MSLFDRMNTAAKLAGFALIICLTMTVNHPAFVLSGVALSSLYLFILMGKPAFKRCLFAAVTLILTAIITSAFSSGGSTTLLRIGSIVFTLEGAVYGLSLGGIFYNMIIWLSCTSYLFDTVILLSALNPLSPTTALVLTITLRFIPRYSKKLKEIHSANIAAAEGGKTFKEKLTLAKDELSILTTWAFENSVNTAEALRSRGYMGGKRTCYTPKRRFDAVSIIYIIINLLSALALIYFAANGSLSVRFYPTIQLEMPYIALIMYIIPCALPALLHLTGELKWKFYLSKI